MKNMVSHCWHASHPWFQLKLNRETLPLTEGHRIHDIFSIAQFVVFTAIAKNNDYDRRL